MGKRSTEKNEPQPTLEALGIRVLDGDEGWVALEKPCGVSVHNEPGRDLVSVVTRLLAADPMALKQGEGSATVHAVHRLDGETSGVVLFAFGKEAARYLTRQFEEKTVVKEYIALVHGTIDEPKGLWDTPLTKEAGGRTNAAGTGKRKPSSTTFSVEARSLRYTLIACSPLSGRKHQIRRHAKLAGHPITGDKRYGTKRALAVLEERFGYKRLGLHARSLTFTPPGANEIRTITSLTSVPQAMTDLMAGDGAHDPLG